jgi:hypothetical protein
MATVPIMDLIAPAAMVARQTPEPVLIDAYRRAARQFCRQSRWLKVTVPGAPTEIDRQTYTLDGDPFHEVVGIRAASAQVAIGDRKAWTLTPSDTTGWNPNELPGRPRRFAYVPEAQVALHPVPDAVYQLTLTLVLQPQRGATQVDEALTFKWDEALIAGALANLLAIADMPWTNPAEAERYRRTFQAGINNARADDQRGHQAGTVIRTSRPFLAGPFR